MIDIPLSNVKLKPVKVVKKKVKKAPVAQVSEPTREKPSNGNMEVVSEKLTGGTIPTESMKELVRSTISRCKNKWPSLLAHAKIVEKFLSEGLFEEGK